MGGKLRYLQLFYGLYLASAVIFIPLKAATRPCSFGRSEPTTGDYFKSAGAGLILGIWLTGFALSFAIICGREGRRKMQVFWALVTLVSMAFFVYAVLQDVSAAVSDNKGCT